MPKGVEPPLHVQPNEEQFTLVLEGKLHYILGDEERILESGDLVLIPRGVAHTSRALDGHATFFTVKSPAGSGNLNEDHQTANLACPQSKLNERIFGTLSAGPSNLGGFT
ncbi:cupin domain-containing protein [Nitrospinota bacterium]